jgi:hypothetical protein
MRKWRCPRLAADCAGDAVTGRYRIQTGPAVYGILASGFDNARHMLRTLILVSDLPAVVMTVFLAGRAVAVMMTGCSGDAGLVALRAASQRSHFEWKRSGSASISVSLKSRRPFNQADIAL